MAELNERQVAHRRAMLAHMTQLARRGESRFHLIHGRGRAARAVSADLKIAPADRYEGRTIICPIAVMASRSDSLTSAS